MHGKQERCQNKLSAVLRQKFTPAVSSNGLAGKPPAKRKKGRLGDRQKKNQPEQEKQGKAEFKKKGIEETLQTRHGRRLRTLT